MAVSQKRSTVGFFNFDGGINTVYAPLNLGDNEMAECINFRLQPRGGLEKRKGYTGYHKFNTGDAVVGMKQLRHAHEYGTTHETHDLVIEGVIIHGRQGQGAWSNITGSITITDDPNLVFSIVQYSNSLVGTNGQNTPFKWSGTGNATIISQAIDGGVDTIDKFTAIVVHDNQVVIGNVTATVATVQTKLGSRVWVADAGTIDDWAPSTDLGVFDVNKDDGGEITGLASVLGYLIVLKNNGLYRVENYGISGQIVKRVSPVGCVGPRAVTVFGSFVYFVDPNGDLWGYDVRGDNEDALINLSSEKLGFRTVGAFDKSRLPITDLSLWRSRNELHLRVTKGVNNQHNAEFVHNVLSRGFYEVEYADNFSLYEEFVSENEVPYMIGGTYNGDTMRMDFGTNDDGEPILATFTTKQVALGAPDVIKMFRRMDLYAAVSQDATIDLEYRTDFDLVGSTKVITVNV